MSHHHNKKYQNAQKPREEIAAKPEPEVIDLEKGETFSETISASETQKEISPAEAKPSLAVPAAIVIAGMFIAGAILYTGSSRGPAPAPGSPAAVLKKGSVAEEIGLSRKKFKECLTSGKYSKLVEKSVSDGIVNGVTGTPRSIIVAKNGSLLLLAGAYPASKVREKVALAMKDDTATETDPDTKTKVTLAPLSKDDHVWGNPNAPVKIVTYTDLECPYSKRFHATMVDLMAEYEKSGEVAWIIRHFPLAQIHDKAPLEAEAAECAFEIGGNEKFFEYVNLLEKITPANNGFDSAYL